MNIKSFLKIFIFLLFILGNLNNVYAEFYSIQVKSFPKEESDNAITFYTKVKNNGYFVYMHSAQVEKESWIRIKIGYFNSIKNADKFGKKFKEETGMDFWVNSAIVSIDSSNSDYSVLTTPSGIWIEKNSKYEEAYSFLPVIYRENLFQDTKAVASPTTDEIVFYLSQKIIKVDLLTNEATILTGRKDIEEMYSPSPKWSFDGKYIAYMDAQTWEVPTRLWVIKNDGSYDKCLVQDITRQNKVKDFCWHRTENEIFFLYGVTHGAMDIGGILYSINAETYKSRLIAQTAYKSNFFIEKLKLVEDGILLSIIQFKDGAPYRKSIIKKIPISVNSPTITFHKEDLK